MGDMDVAPPGPPPPPPPPVEDRCYRHADVITGVHCTRCGRAICTECMHPAPVGHQCPECVKGAKQEFHRAGRSVGSGPASGVTLTKVLLGIMVTVYALEVVVAGPASLMGGPSTRALVRLGGSAGVLVAQGETWRLFTAMFLHIGIFHLLMNCYALYIFGSVIETEDGRVRFVAIFLVGGLFASAVSYAFGEPLVVSAGASGAIFALFGAFLGTAWIHRDLAFYAARVRSAMTLVVLNLVISFAVPGIDWRAHVGGLVAGMVLGIVAGRWRSRPAPFIAACAGLLVLTGALTMWRTDQITEMFVL